MNAGFHSHAPGPTAWHPASQPLAFGSWDPRLASCVRSMARSYVVRSLKRDAQPVPRSFLLLVMLCFSSLLGDMMC